MILFWVPIIIRSLVFRVPLILKAYHRVSSYSTPKASKDALASPFRLQKSPPEKPIVARVASTSHRLCLMCSHQMRKAYMRSEEPCSLKSRKVQGNRKSLVASESKLYLIEFRQQAVSSILSSKQYAVYNFQQIP